MYSQYLGFSRSDTINGTKKQCLPSKLHLLEDDILQLDDLCKICVLKIFNFTENCIKYAISKFFTPNNFFVELWDVRHVPKSRTLRNCSFQNNFHVIKIITRTRGAGAPGAPFVYIRVKETSGLRNSAREMPNFPPWGKVM